MKSNAVKVAKKPSHKPDLLEMRASWVEARLREAPVLKHTLLKRIRERYDCSRGTAIELVARAKERIVLSLQQTREALRAESVMVYESIIADVDTDAGDRCRAREALDTLLGLKSPALSQVQVDLSAKVATSPDDVSTDELCAELPLATRIELLAALRKAKEKKNLAHTGKDSPLPVGLISDSPAIDV